MPNAHTGLQRDVAHGERLPLEAGKRRPRIGQRVDPDAVPGHAVTAGDANQAEEHDDGDSREGKTDHRKIRDDDGADEQLENEQEFALLHQVGLARLVDQLRDVGHRAVDRQPLHVGVGPGTKQQAQHAHHQSREQDLVPRHTEEVSLIEVWEVNVHFATGHVLGGGLGLGRRLAGNQRRHEEQGARGKG